MSRARLDESDVELLALAPMAVAPQRQNEGIGSELVREALERAESTTFPLIVVVGHPDYYPRFGFDPASAYGVACPYEGVPPEAWMAYTLPAYEPGTGGMVVYAEPFGAP
jgi:putative acetyltransferase